MTVALRSALAWSAVAITAAALNLSIGTACATCCRAKASRPQAEWRRRLTGPIVEQEPNDEVGRATMLVEARNETRTRFEGSCADGTRDLFHVAATNNAWGVVVEVRAAYGAPPPATLRAPERNVSAAQRNGRIELELPRDGHTTSVYLEIDCTPHSARSPAYSGWVTAMRPPE